jgi:hypothetical protein
VGSEWEGECWEEGSFDRVMCDVPCSGSAVLLPKLMLVIILLLLLLLLMLMLMVMLTLPLRSALGLRPRLRVGCTAKQLQDLAM